MPDATFFALACAALLTYFAIAASAIAGGGGTPVYVKYAKKSPSTAHAPVVHTSRIHADAAAVNESSVFAPPSVGCTQGIAA